MEYSHNFGSKFPEELIPVGTKKDIDDNVKALISQYHSYIDSGNISNAAILYNNNKEILEPYSASSSYFNRLEEDIYNLGVGLLASTSTVVSNTEPDADNLSTNSHWLQEY